MKLKEFVGRDHNELENAYGFTHYLELLDRLTLGKDQDHTKSVDALLEFVGKQGIQVVKTDNVLIEEVIDISRDDVRKQLLLLENDEGAFYDEDLEISYALLGENFFAYIFPNMLMFSANEKNTKRMAKILDDYSLEYTGPFLRPESAVAPSKILQLKITLDGVKPDIWRRVLVEDSITFHELHQIIQRTMGWENYHAYEFSIGKLSIEGEGDAGFCVDTMFRGFHSRGTPITAATTVIRDMITKEKQRFHYVYDLGDMWRHSIVIEKIMGDDGNQYPVLLGGKRSCPPEDSGGVYGYQELLEIQKDKSHPLYKERIIEWLGEDFDPEYFEDDVVNASLQSRMSAPPRERGKLRKLGRNEPCYCGSGKKYKKCCLMKDLEELGRARKVPLSYK